MKISVVLLVAMCLLHSLADARKNIKVTKKKNKGEVTFTELEILAVNASVKGLSRIKNAEFFGKLPQQVYVQVCFTKLICRRWNHFHKRRCVTCHLIRLEMFHHLLPGYMIFLSLMKSFQVLYF